MSRESFAALRRNANTELAALAEQHLQHDLLQSDRDALRSATRQLSASATVGSVLGLGLGIVLASRVRANKASYFRAFRAMDRPTHVKFADGRTEPLPDISPLLKPTPFGDVAAYLFFSAGGLFLGGELGLLTGSAAASRTITKDPSSKARIEKAFRSIRADVLKKEIEKLEAGGGSGGDNSNQLSL